MEFIALIVRYFMAVQKELTPEDVREAVRKAFPKYEEEIMTIAVKEFIDQGIEQGRQSLLEVDLKILNKKFGKLDSSIERKIEKLSIEELKKLGISLFDFEKVEDLEIWIKNNQ